MDCGWTTGAKRQAEDIIMLSASGCSSVTSSLSEAMQESILAAVPGLRAFAISLCGSADQADDLVQETLLRAITKIDSFQPGTNLCGWLTTILRNQFLSEFRKRRNEIQDADGYHLDALKSAPEQESRVE